MILPTFDHKTELKILIPTIFFALCGLLGVDIHLASLPAIMQFMHTDKAHIQQSISIYLLGMGISILFYGPLSDKYGRKPMVLFGLLLASLASLASCFTHTIDLFLLTRLLQGLGCGVCAGLGRVILADVLLGERFATIGSQFAMVIALSPIVAPTLGGYIQHFMGWKMNFLALSLSLLLSALLYGFISPESNLNKEPHAFKMKTVFAHYYEVLTHRTFLLNTLLSGIVAAISMVYAALSPFIFQTEFHLSPLIYGWITGALGISGLLGRFIIPVFIRKYGRGRHIWICSNMFLITSLLFMLFDATHLMTILLLSILIFFCMFSQTALAPVVVSYAMETFPTKRGVASSFFGSGQMLISFAITGFVGIFPSKGTLVLSSTYLIMALLIGLCVRQLKPLLISSKIP